MGLKDFDFYLPEESIAKYPAIPRHSARLMVLNRKEKSIKHDTFWSLPLHLEKDDLLVFNNTKVIPARLYGKKPTGGLVEILLTDFITPKEWKALLGGKNIKEGILLEVSDDLRVEIVKHVHRGMFLVRILSQDPMNAIQRYGRIPIPPYIKRREEEIDRTYYQTIFATVDGSVAAPTASLHFSQELLKMLEKTGVKTAFVTLHISYGTFKPVEVESLEKHKVDREYLYVPEETVKLIKETKSKGKRVVAVGTTVVRALETKPFEPFEGFTDIYIHPGYEFKVVDALVTNFHLPRSSLLILVCAFAGRKFILEAYNQAIQQGYRFYSYGDGMLIL
ncbi:MAG: tRNA preQ1(34) S-adenosylmethionine ribosyltransferase-isomerase QueA [Aquificaceae bacterium]